MLSVRVRHIIAFVHGMPLPSCTAYHCLRVRHTIAFVHGIPLPSCTAYHCLRVRHTIAFVYGIPLPSCTACHCLRVRHAIALDGIPLPPYTAYSAMGLTGMKFCRHGILQRTNHSHGTGMTVCSELTTVTAHE